MSNSANNSTKKFYFSITNHGLSSTSLTITYIGIRQDLIFKIGGSGTLGLTDERIDDRIDLGILNFSVGDDPFSYWNPLGGMTIEVRPGSSISFFFQYELAKILKRQEDFIKSRKIETGKDHPLLKAKYSIVVYYLESGDEKSIEQIVFLD